MGMAKNSYSYYSARLKWTCMFLTLSTENPQLPNSSSCYPDFLNFISPLGTLLAKQPAAGMINNYSTKSFMTELLLDLC